MVSPKRMTRGLVDLSHAHPPQTLAHIHQALSRVRVPEDLRPLAEDLLAKLVDAHPAVVQGCRAFKDKASEARISL